MARASTSLGSQSRSPSSVNGAEPSAAGCDAAPGQRLKTPVWQAGEAVVRVLRREQAARRRCR